MDIELREHELTQHQTRSAWRAGIFGSSDLGSVWFCQVKRWDEGRVCTCERRESHENTTLQRLWYPLPWAPPASHYCLMLRLQLAAGQFHHADQILEALITNCKTFVGPGH